MNIDWGDGTAHSTPSVVVGVNPAITHTYATENLYTIMVNYLVGAVQTASSIGTYRAKANVPFTSLSPTSVPDIPSGPTAGSLSTDPPNLYRQVITMPGQNQTEASIPTNGSTDAVGTMGQYTPEELADIRAKLPGPTYVEHKQDYSGPPPGTTI